eukprot:COSAG02_NODE_3758_length_6273_cov_8.454810_2_plen_110_part_00
MVPIERRNCAISSRFGLDAEGTEVNSLLWTPKAFAIAVFTAKRSGQEHQQSAVDRRRCVCVCVCVCVKGAATKPAASSHIASMERTRQLLRAEHLDGVALGPLGIRVGI